MTQPWDETNRSDAAGGSAQPVDGRQSSTPGAPDGSYQQYGQPTQQYGQGAQPGQQYGQFGQPYQPPVTGPKRPGAVTAAAVLAFVHAGLLLIGGIAALSGGTSILDVSSSEGSTFATMLTILGIVGLACGGVLIGGGVQSYGGKLNLVVVGSAVAVVLCIAWFILLISYDLPTGVALVWPLIYAVLPVIAISLTMGASAQLWAKTKSA